MCHIHIAAETIGILLLAFARRKKTLRITKSSHKAPRGEDERVYMLYGRLGWKLFTGRGQYSQFKRTIYKQAKKFQRISLSNERNISINTIKINVVITILTLSTEAKKSHDWLKQEAMKLCSQATSNSKIILSNAKLTNIGFIKNCVGKYSLFS